MRRTERGYGDWLVLIVVSKAEGENGRRLIGSRLFF